MALRFLSVFVAAAAGAAAASAPEIQLERIIMPDAAPSSFAVGLPSGVNFCFDPVRGGVSYVWQGNFIDVTPARPGAGKLIKPVKLLGEVVYRESAPSPLRRGDVSREPVVVFKGYRFLDGAIEFSYTVDGVLVREEISARPGGDGLIRRFRTEPGDSDTRWWYVPGPTEGSTLTSAAGRLENGAYRFDPGSSRDFALAIVFRPKQP
jgi:hypothetical protein